MSQLIATSYEATSGGTAFVEILDSQTGDTVQARTSVGVVESPSGVLDGNSLYYWIATVTPELDAYTAIWDLGGAGEAREVIFPSTGGGGGGSGTTVVGGSGEIWPLELEQAIARANTEPFAIPSSLPSGGTDGQVLTKLGDTAVWSDLGTGSGAPTGAAGGDLTGTYPNPLIAPGGLNGEVLTTVGGNAEWALLPGLYTSSSNPGTGVYNIIDQWHCVADCIRDDTGRVDPANLNDFRTSGNIFQAGDVGKTIQIAYGIGQVHQTTIAAFVTAKRVTLTTPVPATCTNATFAFGTDNSPLLQAGFDSLPGDSAGKEHTGASGGMVLAPAGQYLMSSQVTCAKGGIAFHGLGGRAQQSADADGSNYGGPLFTTLNGISMFWFGNPFTGPNATRGGQNGPNIQRIQCSGGTGHKVAEGIVITNTHSTVRDCSFFDLAAGCVLRTMDGRDTSWAAVQNTYARNCAKGVWVDDTIDYQGASNAWITGGDFQIYDNDIAVAWSTGYGRIGEFKVGMHGADSYKLNAAYSIGELVTPSAGYNGYYYQVTTTPAWTNGGGTYKTDAVTEPTWPLSVGATVTHTDGYTWTARAITGPRSIKVDGYAAESFAMYGNSDHGHAHDFIILPTNTEHHTTTCPEEAVMIEVKDATGPFTIYGPNTGGGGGAVRGTGILIHGTDDGDHDCMNGTIIGGGFVNWTIPIDIGPTAGNISVIGTKFQRWTTTPIRINDSSVTATLIMGCGTILGTGGAAADPTTAAIIDLGTGTQIVAWQNGTTVENTPTSFVSKGISTQTPGAVSTVTIPHGLGSVPAWFEAQAQNTAARGAPAFYLTADATVITLNFASNLTAATSYQWLWRAELA